MDSPCALECSQSLSTHLATIRITIYIVRRQLGIVSRAAFQQQRLACMPSSCSTRRSHSLKTTLPAALPALEAQPQARARS